ncbi:hypothetical protein Tco_0284393, partial [Tanacetum coccineum]
SDTESEHSEQSSDDIPMQDEGHVSDLEDTDNAHIPKRITGQIHTPQRIKFPRRTSFKGRCMILGHSSNGSAERTGKKKLCKADLEGPAFKIVKAFHKNSVFLQFQMDECHKLLMNKVDLVNPEGHQIL